MSVNIQVTAETAQAAKAMTAFTTQATAGLKTMETAGKQAAASAAATTGVVAINAATARAAGDSLKKTTGDLNNAIKTVAISASVFAGPVASSIVTPLLLFSREIKTIGAGLRLAGLSIPVLAVGILGLSAILGAGSFYFSDYNKATAEQEKASDSLAETNEKLAASILNVAKARREAGAMSEETFNQILRDIKAAGNQITDTGTAEALRSLRARLRGNSEFTPPVAREKFDKDREVATAEAALRVARSEMVLAREPNALKDNNWLRLDELDRNLRALDQRRIDAAAAREAKIITAQEFRKLEIVDLNEIANLETQRTDILARRIQNNFRLTDAEKFKQLRAAGVPQEELGANPESFTQQMSSQFAQLQNQIGTFSQASAGFITGGLGSAMQGVSDSIMGVIEGSKNMAQVWGSVLRSMLAQAVQFSVQQLAVFLLNKAKELFAHTTTETAKTTATVVGAGVRTSAAIGEAGAEAVVTGTKAASSVADIPYVGWALAIAAFGSIIAMVAQASGNARELGGPVVAGQPFLVGEGGPELFVPREHGDILTNGRTREVMTRTGGAGSAASGGGSTVNQKMNILIDRAAWVRASRDDIAAIAIDAVRNHKVELGFQT